MIFEPGDEVIRRDCIGRVNIQNLPLLTYKVIKYYNGLIVVKSPDGTHQYLAEENELYPVSAWKIENL